MSIKDVVTFFKQSSLNSKLTSTLKQEVATRWNSELIMLESYLKAASEVQNLLLQNGKINKLSNIDNESVKELVDFLRPFEECTKVFSQDSQPTLHQIAPWFHKLHQHLEINEDDSDELKLLKGQAMICFAEYCKTSTMHYVAALLNPK